jgi:hypothetical protein
VIGVCLLEMVGSLSELDPDHNITDPKCILKRVLTLLYLQNLKKEMLVNKTVAGE